MTLDRRTQEELLAYCGGLHDDDCIDPRAFSQSKRDHEKAGRKAKQLCRQVAETLDLVLSGDCRDEQLQNLHVVSVAPAPDASRLLVTVCTDVPEEHFDRQSILNRLGEQVGRLRCEVAAAINRKRVPTFVFHVVGPEGNEGLGTRGTGALSENA